MPELACRVGLSSGARRAPRAAGSPTRRRPSREHALVSPRLHSGPRRNAGSVGAAPSRPVVPSLICRTVDSSTAGTGAARRAPPDGAAGSQTAHRRGHGTLPPPLGVGLPRPGTSRGDRVLPRLRPGGHRRLRTGSAVGTLGGDRPRLESRRTAEPGAAVVAGLATHARRAPQPDTWPPPPNTTCPPGDGPCGATEYT